MHTVGNILRPKSCSPPNVLCPCYLIVVHAVSSFVGYGKKTAWSPWNTLPQPTDALLKLSCAPSEIPNDVMLIIEIFSCYLTRPAHGQIYTKLDKDFLQREPI